MVVGGVEGGLALSAAKMGSETLKICCLVRAQQRRFCLLAGRRFKTLGVLGAHVFKIKRITKVVLGWEQEGWKKGKNCVCCEDFGDFFKIKNYRIKLKKGNKIFLLKCVFS